MNRLLLSPKTIQDLALKAERINEIFSSHKYLLFEDRPFTSPKVFLLQALAPFSQLLIVTHCGHDMIPCLHAFWLLLS